MKKTTSGFTLVELMIVVAIIAVLASIALPQYQNYIIKTNRAEAKGLLLELTHYMERRFTEIGRYCDNPCSPLPSLPFTTSPKGGATNASYQLSLATGTNAPTTTTYTLLALPRGRQATGDTACGTLSIDQANVKCMKVGNTGGKCSDDTNQQDRDSVAFCW